MVWTPAGPRSARALLASGAVMLLASLWACGDQPPAREPAPALGTLRTAGAGHAFFEVYEPRPPVRGTMITLHGGGWLNRRGDARRIMGGPALTLQQEHWRVVNVEYRRPAGYGSASPDPRPPLTDVVAFYDQVRRAFPGPVCADGASAGGHLAAMLAVVRPSLTCAVIAAAPLDLPSLLSHTSALGRALVTRAFGRTPATLRSWSPARTWDRGRDRTRFFVTDADNDPLVPRQQGDAFAAADPGAQTMTLAGSQGAGAAPYVHSGVTRAALATAIAAQARWLDAVVPVRPTPPTAAGPDGGLTCVLPAGTDPADLLRAGSAWVQTPSTDRLLAATAGCGGRGGRQDEGLSVWAFPREGVTVPVGVAASLAYRAPRPLRRLDASLRGFLARPREWSVGLYATRTADGPVNVPVATCDLGVCRGLRLVSTRDGALVTVPGAGRRPDGAASPPVHRFRLPPGTRQVAWRLTCVAVPGCSLTGPPPGARPRDPLGHPAILSVYRVAVR